ncbi:MAG: outer membrane beta-barrel protein [Saprospiraceae bacterium]|nr:outer membrane beta-barrel protein [Saprospiraceae bacterium]
MKKLLALLLMLSTLHLNAQDQKPLESPTFDVVVQLSDDFKRLKESFGKGEIDAATYKSRGREILSQLSASSYEGYEKLTYEPVPTTPADATIDVSDPGMGMPSDTTPQDFEMPEMGSGRSPMGLLSGNKKRTSFKIRYGMYWNGLKQGTKNASISYPKFNTWSSYNWFGEFDILLNTRLGGSKSPFSIYYGIGWDNRCFVQKKDVQKLGVANGEATFTSPTEKVDRSKIELGFLRIPVGLQFKSKKFALNLGGYVGFNTSHSQTLEYTTADDEAAELQLDKDYDFTKTNYGLSASIGYKRVHIGVNYDLSTLFKNSNDYEFNAWRIGLLIF